MLIFTFGYTSPKVLGIFRPIKYKFIINTFENHNNYFGTKFRKCNEKA